MANNFRYQAAANTCFVDAFAGSDTNDGLTPDTPKKTLAAANAIGRAYIICHGHFKNEVFGTIEGKRLIADGICIIEYPNNTTSIFGGSTYTGNGYIYGFIFKNINGTGLIFGNYAPSIYNCYFENCYVGLFRVAKRCYFINCYVNQVNQIYYSSFFNSYININNTNIGIGELINYCYFNQTCLVELSTGLIYSNVYNYYHNSKFKVGSTYYDDLAAFKVAYPSLSATNTNTDPLFNNAAKKDFTVQAGSPALTYKIGNAIEGYPIYWSNGTTDWTISNLSVIGGNSLEVNDATNGSIERNATAPFDLGAIKNIQNIDYMGFFKFVLAETKVNVPAITQYTVGQSGYMPKRMTFQLKWSETALSEAQWNLKEWVTFDIKLVTYYSVALSYADDRNRFRFDGTYGDGSPEFDYTMLPHIGNIKGRYFLIKFVLRNDF